MNNWKKWIPVAALACMSCSHARKEALPVVRTARIDTVRISTVAQQSIYAGKIHAGADVNVAFRVAGTIERILCREGDFVRKGTVIAELDARDYQVQLAAVEAEYNQIKTASERVIELYGRGSATRSDYEKADYGLQQITAKYDHHKNQLTDTRLTAPFDGYIREKLHDAGETVAAGMPVLSMIGAGDWQVEIGLPVQDYTRRNDFERFEALVSTSPGVPLELETLELTPKSTAAQLYRMRFRIKKTDGVMLAAGMSVEVSITFRTGETTACQIPVAALFERDGKPHVWVFTSEHEPPEARPVRISEVRRNGNLLVEEGLREGEQIVTAGVHSLKDGMRVKPLPAPTETNVGGLL
ncbi:MAG: efflux RND transporter periplasmic adaptor subunit [Tannerella sp.]|nr:efflux RND transporter periplasmic adaptor subunit [Tannerella sp.]